MGQVSNKSQRRVNQCLSRPTIIMKTLGWFLFMTHFMVGLSYAAGKKYDFRAEFVFDDGEIPKAGVLYYPEKNYTVNNITVDQKDRQFSDLVFVAQPGSKIFYKNTDRVRHNIFSYNYEQDYRFDVGIMSKKSLIERTVDWQENTIIRLACYIHSTMQAYAANIPSNHYGVLNFEVVETSDNSFSKSKYKRRFLKKKLTNRVIIKLEQFELDRDYVLLMPYKDPITIHLSSKPRQSIDILLKDRKVGVLNIELLLDEEKSAVMSSSKESKSVGLNKQG